MGQLNCVNSHAQLNKYFFLFMNHALTLNLQHQLKMLFMDKFSFVHPE